jgi:PAS domain S-box-containing protein
MQIYLLATNFFAITALLLGLGGLPGRGRSSRLLPLFLLAINRSVILIVYLAASNSGQITVSSVVSALEVFSTFCIVWILSGPIANLPAPWQNLTRVGIGIALLLSFLPLLPGWPIPYEINSLIIAVFSPLLLLLSLGQVRWTHLAPPLILALANFFLLVELNSLAWLVSLLAYAFLISAVHQETLQVFRSFYEDRRQVAETLTQEAITQRQEQQRWLEASKMITSVSDLEQSIEHVAQSMAQITHVDQSVIFMLDTKNMGKAHLATFYSPEGSFYITSRDEIAFSLDECPVLKKAIEERQQLLLPQQNSNGLHALYSLWYEEKAGPTLIQPLTVQGQAVGALVLGNPVSHRPIYDSDARLCKDLSSQIANIVEYWRRYRELELQAEAMAAAVQEHMGSAPPSPVQAEEVVASPEQTNEADEAYLAIFQSISDGVVVSDQLGRVRWVNQAGEQLLGKPSQALIGQPIGTIYGEIDSREPIEDLVVAFSRRNQPLPTFIETDERAIQGRLIPWRNEEREWMGIIAVFRDVTREVKADRSRNDFIAALSRELRAPLTTVKGYSELITNGVMDDYSSDQLHIQHIIHSSAERMVDVLDNAIQITAQNRHQILPRFEEIDVEIIINEALREIASLAQLRELELQREIKPELPKIAADPRHLRRILDNLLSNACRFTPPGGRITLRAWPQSERVGNIYRPQLYLSVADNGVGIPPSEVKRVFDPFYQVKNQGMDEDGGMGMGLTVVRELVQLHNGRVWVESVPSEGSVFYVALPLSQEY